MQSVIRAINVVFGPMLTLLLAPMFAGLTIGGRNAGDIAGGAAAGLLVLGVELVLTRGPVHSATLRRWLDPRAVFEGIWIQEVTEGPTENAFAVLSVSYHAGGDTFIVKGSAYSADATRWAEWTSTHVFIDKDKLEATYRWEGEMLDRRRTPAAEKSGFTQLRLRKAPPFSIPLTGEGKVLHLGEETRLRFDLIRVTNRLLEKRGLPFRVRDLQLDANDEESQLVASSLAKGNRFSLERQAPDQH